VRELEELFKVTKLQTLGPYHLQLTCQMLHETYKVQFFVFGNSTTRHKLNYMFPEKYNDELIPIYLYQRYDDPNHLIYIKNLRSYFKANYSICFECKKTFRTHTYRHLCTQRATCFACRRFFQSDTTYLHEKLKSNFCNKLVSIEPFLKCDICKCILYSQHCLKGHRQFCNGTLGRFGWKCDKCNKFIYASGNQTSTVIRNSHVCSNGTTCKFCLTLK